MIGILYLVLLGLVALNVPDSILDAFRNLTVSLGTSTQNTQAGIDNMYDAFRATKLKDEPERARPVLQKAEQASQYVLNLTGFIDSVKQQMTEEGGGILESTGDLRKRDNLSISTRQMIHTGHASRLKALILETKNGLNELTRNEVPFSLEAVDPPARGGSRKAGNRPILEMGCR